MPRRARYSKHLKIRIDEATLQLIDEISQKLSLNKSATIRLLIIEGYKRIRHRLIEYKEQW